MQITENEKREENSLRSGFKGKEKELRSLVSKKICSFLIQNGARFILLFCGHNAESLDCYVWSCSRLVLSKVTTCETEFPGLFEGQKYSWFIDKYGEICTARLMRKA